MSGAIRYDYCEVGEPLVERLHLHVQRGESFVLLGYQGAGKRQAVQRLAYRLKTEERPYLAVWFPNFSTIVTEAELLTVCKERLYHFLSNDVVNDLSRATSMVDWFYRLGKISNGRTFPLCFVNIDCLAEPIKERLLALIRDAVQNKHIVVCLTGESILAHTLGQDTSPFQCTYQYVLVGHDKDTARKFFEKRVRACGINFQDPEDVTWKSGTAFDAFYELTGGNFNLLRAILWCLSERGLRFDEDPEKHPGYPRSIIQRSLFSYTAVPLFGLNIFDSAIKLIQQDRKAFEQIENLLDQIQAARDAWKPLHTACLEASLPVLHQNPEFLELAGLLRRNLEDGRLYFPSFYVAEYVFSYFSWSCRGDFHAKEGDWEKAFARYERVEDGERKVRPLGEHDYQNVRAIVNRLCREFAELIPDEEATRKMRWLWEQCGRLLFGLQTAAVLRLDGNSTWIVEANEDGRADRFDAIVKSVLKTTPISGTLKQSDESFDLYLHANRRVMLLRNRPGTFELKPSHAVLAESSVRSPIDGLRQHLLEVALTTFLTCYNEARLQRRMRRGRLRLGAAMQRLFEHTNTEESLEALGRYLHEEFLTTGVRLFLMRSGKLQSAKSWGFKDPKRRLDFDSGGIEISPDRDPELWAALNERKPIAFRWCPGGGTPPATTDLSFRSIPMNAYAEQVERRPGDYWIDFPLFIGEQPYGKLTLEFSSEAPPPARYLDDLNVIAAVLSHHLEHLSLDEIRLAEMRSMQQRAIAITAHDLATRIASLPVFLADYRDLEDTLTGSARAELKRINDGFKNRLEAAMDILGRAKLRLGEVRATYSQFNLVEVVREALHSIDPSRGGGYVEIVDADANGGIIIEADRSHMGGVFLELVSNSISMQREGTALKVHVRMERRPPENRIVIDYVDNGPGVPEDLKERIFEYLLSYRPGQTRKGMGLGLGYVRETIKAHQGTIREQGLHGQGACFHIELPIRRANL